MSMVIPELPPSPLMPTLPLLTLADAIEQVADTLTSVLDLDETSPVPAHAATVVWGLILGQLRGRIPLPIPFDLLMVATSASIRWVNFLLRFRMTPINPGSGAVSDTSDVHFQGFTISELMTLWRYRIRTA